jgi:hypothetical protein
VPFHSWLALRSARRVVQAIAFVTVLVLGVNVPGGSAEAAVAGPRVAKAAPHAPAIPRDRRVPFRWQTPRKAKAPQSFKKYDPMVDSKLPGPGSATIDLTAVAAPATSPVPGARATRALAGLRRAGGLPVLVGPSPARPGRSPAAVGPGRLTVRVTDQKTASAAGIHGILFSVTSSRAGPVMVAVDDSSFAAAFRR